MNTHTTQADRTNLAILDEWKNEWRVVDDQYDYHS